MINRCGKKRKNVYKTQTSGIQKKQPSTEVSLPQGTTDDKKTGWNEKDKSMSSSLKIHYEKRINPITVKEQDLIDRCAGASKTGYDTITNSELVVGTNKYTCTYMYIHIISYIYISYSCGPAVRVAENGRRLMKSWAAVPQSEEPDGTSARGS